MSRSCNNFLRKISPYEGDGMNKMPPDLIKKNIARLCRTPKQAPPLNLSSMSMFPHLPAAIPAKGAPTHTVKRITIDLGPDDELRRQRSSSLQQAIEVEWKHNDHWQDIICRIRNRWPHSIDSYRFTNRKVIVFFPYVEETCKVFGLG